MKIIDLTSGLRTAISNEENLLVEKFKTSHGSLFRSELDEREQMLAVELVKKGVLTRTKLQGKINYNLPNTENIWRI